MILCDLMMPQMTGMDLHAALFRVHEGPTPEKKEVLRNYWRLVQRYRATMLSAVPTVLAALVLAVFVGRHPIGTADYPHLLTSIHVTFAALAGVCLLAVGASLLPAGKAEAAAKILPADSGEPPH